ncbi:hypothetical protein A2U01_0102347, partial [Trifolium medium]|nr:hypothetical protein [Trifolium medium]
VQILRSRFSPRFRVMTVRLLRSIHFGEELS